MNLLLDDGFQFGLGLFETIAVEQGEPLLLSYHLERLQSSMEFLNISQQIHPAQIRSYLDEQPSHHHGLKIMVSQKNCLFTMRPNPYTKERYEIGFVLDYSPILRNETSPLTYHKTMNYGDCILEKRRATSLGIDELVFCNSRGEICEGTTTNVFFVKDGVIYTPPVSAGLLPGVMRRCLMEQFSVVEKTIFPSDVPKMEECFVTNSLLGIMPVTKFSGTSFFAQTVTRKCMTAWDEFVKKATSHSNWEGIV